MAAPSTHDLLSVDSVEELSGIKSAPSWVVRSLELAPYVTVRRCHRSNAEIPVGVRGSRREERWASFISPHAISRSLAPTDLRISQLADPARLKCIDAFMHLQHLEQTWREIKFRWGPGGSVGFELASGVHTCTPTSDLDIVIFAPDPMSLECAEQLLLSAKTISASIDILVEAPLCGFSLQEYVNSKDNLILRFADGPRLANNPWQKQPALR